MNNGLSTAVNLILITFFLRLHLKATDSHSTQSEFDATLDEQPDSRIVFFSY